MAYQALYRTYRPNTFDEVVGQKHIVTTLKNAIAQNKIAHAYLFCGPRGTGKTTIARLLAKAVNCESEGDVPCNKCSSCQAITDGSHPDIIEIDGASYNRVDTARDLIEKVKYAPLQAKYKVYIIDEVHMLSDSAFNALLKTLEEPPVHAIFILATTEVNKVLPTIVSRCQRFDFNRIEEDGMIERLKEVLENEKMEYEEDALKTIAELADGGMRDALSALDQVIAYTDKKITAEDVYEVYGISSPLQKYELLQLTMEKKVEETLQKARKLMDSGSDIKRLTNEMIEILKETVIYSYTQNASFLKNIKKEQAKSLLGEEKPKNLLSMIDILSEAIQKYTYSVNISSVFEVALLKMMSLEKLFNETQEIANSATVQRIEKKTEETKQEEKEPEPVKFDKEYLLSLLFAANKLRREELNGKWTRMNEYSNDYRYARFASQLEDSSLGACGKNYIVIYVSYQAKADIINGFRENVDFRNLMKEITGEETKVIALSKDGFSQLIAEFRKRSEENRPVAEIKPEPIVQKEEIKENDETEDVIEKKMTEIFGAGNYEVID